VNSRFRLATLALAALALCAASGPGERWQMQYFYDPGKASFAISDMQALSATHVVVVGEVVENNGKSHKPAAVTTVDGGAHWSLANLEESPVSLFFLNDSLGWMVTEKNLWKTAEAGKDWHKIAHLPAPAFRVWFADENTGWAACAKKQVLVTHDGGRKWDPVPAAAEPSGVPERSGYNWIAFASAQFGIITGFNQPLQRWAPMFPTWLDPQDALSRRETPHLYYALTTTDAGKTWKPQTASLLGHVTRVRLSPNGTGLGLIEYADSFKYPSETFKIDWKTGGNTTIFRDKRYAISDVWLAADGSAYLAGIAASGEVRSLSPGKVKVFRSTDFTTWTEMEVDYRAVAQRVLLAGSGDDLWMATDDGMILKRK
jgi:photosystem II stability/assembly factor-like uncharacterized protein